MDHKTDTRSLVCKVFSPEENVDGTDRFSEGFRHSFFGQSHNFFNYTRDLLCYPDARIATIVDLETGEVIAGARSVVDGANQLAVGPVYVDQAAWGQGHAPVLVASLRLDRFASPLAGREPVTEAQLFVRILDEQPNHQAFSAYLKVGFSKFRVHRLPVPDDDLGRHLAQTANPDGSYSTLEMRADGASLEACRRIVRAFYARRAAA